MQDMSQCMEDHLDINVLNLDVTAMMAYVSNMTNGYCRYVFKQDVLTQQAAWEAERPVKPILEKLFAGETSNLQIYVFLYFKSILVDYIHIMSYIILLKLFFVFTTFTHVFCCFCCLV